MKPLRIHYLQHNFFEGLGSIEEWVNTNQHTLTYTRFFEKSIFPSIEEIDWLIIMGGAMSVYDEERFPWLVEEKKFIKQAVISGKTVIGVCLGSQLLAEALGSKVYPNTQKEIGWYPIEWNEEAIKNKLFNKIKNPATVFHWHGDTFDIPKNSLHLASSQTCKNQGFLFRKKILGMQFHLEMTENSIKQMLENCRIDLGEGRIQTEKEILSHSNYSENKEILFTILNKLCEEN